MKGLPYCTLTQYNLRQSEKKGGRAILHVGVDQHKKFSQVAVVNEAGKVLENCRVYHDDKDEIRRFFRKLGEESTVALSLA